jgi:hypothetical protein
MMNLKRLVGILSMLLLAASNCDAGNNITLKNKTGGTVTVNVVYCKETFLGSGKWYCGYTYTSFSGDTWAMGNGWNVKEMNSFSAKINGKNYPIYPWNFAITQIDDNATYVVKVGICERCIVVQRE